MKQMCNPINDLLIAAHAGMNMAYCEGAARLWGDQKELLCFCAARALSIVNSEPGSCVPTSGNRSQHLNGSKWHQNKSPSAKGAKWLKDTAGKPRPKHKWNTLWDNSMAVNQKGGGRELKPDTRKKLGGKILYVLHKLDLASFVCAFTLPSFSLNITRWSTSPHHLWRSWETVRSTPDHWRMDESITLSPVWKFWPTLKECRIKLECRWLCWLICRLYLDINLRFLSERWRAWLRRCHEYIMKTFSWGQLLMGRPGQ